MDFGLARTTVTGHRTMYGDDDIYTITRVPNTPLCTEEAI